MSLTCLAATCQPSPSHVPAVELRALPPDDDASVLEIFAGLGARSRELRFLTPKPHLTAADLRALTAVDHHDHVAILAVSARSGRPIGVARFVRDPQRPDTADVAVAVVDAWQDRGIGTLLSFALAERAQEVGIRRFTLVMSQDNEAAVRLLHRTPGEIHRVAIDTESAEFEVTLSGSGALR
jgi:RimJ/RimL family protein N-acetyltransferase